MWLSLSSLHVREDKDSFVQGGTWSKPALMCKLGAGAAHVVERAEAVEAVNAFGMIEAAEPVAAAEAAEATPAVEALGANEAVEAMGLVKRVKRLRRLKRLKQLMRFRLLGLAIVRGSMSARKDCRSLVLGMYVCT